MGEVDKQSILLDERISEIESRITFQDNHIQELNDTVAKLQLEVMDINERQRATLQQIEQLTPSIINSLDEERPPPHY
ncbi:MAG: SlyX family protein [Thiotrichales bacterium]|jgi:SlyX protein|nr:SlyX family protein [Thiotrichales bacterium]MBT3613559.1 SlyX family protein [Thiotrichales bacterium]MBT3752367.1 SlyX family protein [Thiotrichales bacterium]MBT3838027.1 SlyX family protein [Thiotrichales bacterium]MBT4152138.1 SlyX family protein [Thiotrichales bacterium]